MRTIAIEGPCCAGKSSLVRALELQHAVATIAEYTDLERTLPPYPPKGIHDVRSALEHFARLEQRRHTRWRSLRHNHATVLLDRSFLSTIAFHDARTNLLEHEVSSYVRTFWRQSRHVIVPDEVWLLLADASSVTSRAQNASGRYLPLLLDATFNELFANVIADQCSKRGIPCWVLDTSERSCREVVRLASERLSSQSS